MDASMLKIIIAGIAAIVALTINVTIDQNGILMSTIFTSFTIYSSILTKKPVSLAAGGLRGLVNTVVNQAHVLASTPGMTIGRPGKLSGV